MVRLEHHRRGLGNGRMVNFVCMSTGRIGGRLLSFFLTAALDNEVFKIGYGIVKYCVWTRVVESRSLSKC